MALRLFQVNFKAGDDSALGRFWAEALGWRVAGAEPGATSVKPVDAVWPDPAAVRMDVIAVPNPGTVEYRAHIELATTSAAHHTELIARLKELGATPAATAQGALPRTVLADPEGNVFCVLEPGRPTETPARSPRSSSTARTLGPWPVSGARRWPGPRTR